MTEIRDPDLIEWVEKARINRIGYEIIVGLATNEQAQRDARSQMTPVQRRRDIARRSVENVALSDDDRNYIHSVLALCGLPYRNPGDGVQKYQRDYNRNSLVVQAGVLKHPETGEMQDQGIPYGPKARLLLLYLCTSAVKQKSPIIEIPDSLSAFIRDMGFSVTGGPKGTLSQFKEQLNRLAGCTLHLGLWDGHHAKTIKQAPIDTFEVWLPKDPNQQVLWPTTIELSDKFYNSLREHALPVDVRAVRAFANSARKLDIVFWLGHRLRTVKKMTVVPWDAILEQFGTNGANRRRTKQNIIEDISDIKDVYDSLPVEIVEAGFRLHPTEPDRWLVPPKRKIGKFK